MHHVGTFAILFLSHVTDCGRFENDFLLTLDYDYVCSSNSFDTAGTMHTTAKCTASETLVTDDSEIAI